MKKSIAFKLFAFALMSVIVSSCSKYEEGSKFTVLTKKSRVVNIWKIDKITSVDDASGYSADVTSFSPTYTVEMTKEGVATTTVGSFSETGTWAFTSDKSGLIMTDNSGTSETLTIIKLKKDELKVSSSNNGTTTIYEYVTN